MNDKIEEVIEVLEKIRLKTMETLEKNEYSFGEDKEIKSAAELQTLVGLLPNTLSTILQFQKVIEMNNQQKEAPQERA